MLFRSPTPRPRRGSCLPPAARAPGARSRSAPPFSFPPHTEDDRFISRENFLNVLQSLPGPFAVHQAAELEPQCPMAGEAVRNGVRGPWDGGRAAPPHPRSLESLSPGGPQGRAVAQLKAFLCLGLRVSPLRFPNPLSPAPAALPSVLWWRRAWSDSLRKSPHTFPSHALTWGSGGKRRRPSW